MAKPSKVKGVGPGRRGRRAARLMLSARLDDLRRYEHAAGRFDEEAIHDLRVSTRRLRAALRALGNDGALKRSERRARALQDALGQVRDAQVQLRWLRGSSPRELRGRVVRELIRRAEHTLPTHEASLEAALDRWRKRDAPRLVARIRSATVHKLGGGSVLRRFREAFRAVDAALVDAPDLSDPAVAHRLRIAIKKLRYQTELLAPLFPKPAAALERRLGALQRTLGDLHDLDVRRAHVEQLGSSLRADRELRLIHRLDSERKRLAAQAARHARAWIRQKIGEKVPEAFA